MTEYHRKWGLSNIQRRSKLRNLGDHFEKCLIYEHVSEMCDVHRKYEINITSDVVSPVPVDGIAAL